MAAPDCMRVLGYVHSCTCAVWSTAMYAVVAEFGITDCKPLQRSMGQLVLPTPALKAVFVLLTVFMFCAVVQVA